MKKYNILAWSCLEKIKIEKRNGSKNSWHG